MALVELPIFKTAYEQALESRVKSNISRYSGKIQTPWALGDPSETCVFAGYRVPNNLDQILDPLKDDFTNAVALHRALIHLTPKDASRAMSEAGKVLVTTINATSSVRPQAARAASIRACTAARFKRSSERRDDSLATASTPEDSTLSSSRRSRGTTGSTRCRPWCRSAGARIRSRRCRYSATEPNWPPSRPHAVRQCPASRPSSVLPTHTFRQRLARMPAAAQLAQELHRAG